MIEDNTPALQVQQTPLASSSESKRALAIGYAELGLPVFPLISNGKTPALAGDWKARATTDPERVADTWTRTCPVTGAEPDCNIGIATGRPFGKGFMFVVDVDTRDGKTGDKSLALLEAVYDELPKTFTVRTTSGGRHLYFLSHAPVGNSVTKIGTHIDVKGLNGYVVAPGSTIDGVSYDLETAVPIAPAPQWLVQLAGASRKRVATMGEPLAELDTQAAIARATEWLAAKAPEAVEGNGGDNTTIKVINRVGDFGVSPETALDLLLEHWNGAKAIPPWDPDDLAEKVRSAFKSRQNPVGIASAEAEFEAVEIDTKPAPKRGLHFTTWRDIQPDLDQPCLIDGVIDLSTMVVTYGDSNTGKTYVKLDQAFHIAAGRSWNGHKVKQGAVVYIAAEGGAGFGRRVAAFKKKYGLEDLPFAVVPCPVDLFSDQGDTGKLVKLVREVEARFDQKCVLIVVDTLARAMAGGDENTSADMGKFVRNCDQLRAATGATVNIIHHTGKDKAKGARGSSALRAATDTEIEIDVGLLNVTKQRDMARGEKMKFELEQIEIGHRSDGKVVTGCVVHWLFGAESEFAPPLDPKHQEALEALEIALKNKGEGASSVSFTEWTSAYAEARRARGKITGEKQALVRCSKGLIQAGYAAKTSNNQYVRTSA